MKTLPPSNADQVITAAEQLSQEQMLAVQQRARHQQIDAPARYTSASHPQKIRTIITKCGQNIALPADATTVAEAYSALAAITSIAQGLRPTQQDASCCGLINNLSLTGANDVLRIARALYRTDAELAEVTKAHINNGSTKTTCILIHTNDDQRAIVTSNCGDSGALLILQLADDHFQIEPLAVTHNPDDPLERQRILSEGGHICPNVPRNQNDNEQACSDGRLNCNLMLSRGFGDQNAGPGFSHTPDTSLFQIPSDAKQAYVLLFSDGFSDDLSATDIRDNIAEILSFANPAAVLAMISHILGNDDNSSLTWVDALSSKKNTLRFFTVCDGHGKACATTLVSFQLVRRFGPLLTEMLRREYPALTLPYHHILCPATIPPQQKLPQRKQAHLTLRNTKGLYRLFLICRGLTDDNYHNFRHFMQCFLLPLQTLLDNGKPIPGHELRSAATIDNDGQNAFFAQLCFINSLAHHIQFNRLLFSVADIVYFCLLLDGFSPFSQHQQIQQFLQKPDLPREIVEHYRDFLCGNLADAPTQLGQSRLTRVYQRQLRPLQNTQLTDAEYQPWLNTLASWAQQPLAIAEAEKQRETLRRFQRSVYKLARQKALAWATANNLFAEVARTLPSDNPRDDSRRANHHQASPSSNNSFGI